VTVTADQNVTRSAEAVTEIAAGGAVEEPPAPEEAPGAKPRGALPPPSGPLKVEVAQTDNPIRVGAKTTYIIVIENDRDVSDKNVTLTIRIPEGLRYEKFISAIPDKVQLKDNGRTVAAPPVAELRPKEKLAPFRLEVTGVTPGKHQLRVEVASLRLDTPIQTDMETTVLAE
jgi:hypothetical protein